MNAKRFFGLVLVLVAVLTALGLDAIGRDHQPRSYTLDFTGGTNLSGEAERTVERIAAAMQRQPAYSAVIVGHTGTRGDPGANQALGRDRAKAVARELAGAGVDGARLEAFSAGADQPLERREDEGNRGYQSRLSRAEVRLNP